jgi:electron transfer flavoprotein alpha subunit
MSVLVYLESENKAYKKSAYELASYASALANQLSTEAIGLVINNDTPENIGGLNQIISISNESLNTFTAERYASQISTAFEKSGAQYLVISSSADSKYIGGMIAAQSGSSFIPNVIALPENIGGKTAFKRTVFTNKGFAYTSSKSDRCIIGLSKNSFGVHHNDAAPKVEVMTLELSNDRVTVTNQATADGKVTIADADIVVSAGRGLKGPENWHLVEDLAEVLGAATACSKPVSDLGWRPHSEHVGQTGKPVATNLYIAIGISGAIQHLAGINASKVKVVINNDPEAPFFKAADYGIVGDAFTVVPQLIEKLKAFKAQNA